VLHKLRKRVQEEKGFTLIELLVVILIIGILAAIAIPSFINQRSKGQDAVAKSDVRTAQTAEETYFTDNQAYTATPTDLTGIEPTLSDANLLTAAVGNGTLSNSFKVSVKSKSSAGTVYTVARNADGTVSRTCAPAGGGCTNSTW
jgi:type IV pilus assembly protein PilA